MGLNFRLRMAKLSVITDLRRSRGDFTSFVADVLEAGADIIDIRDADAPPAELVAGLEAARQAAMRTQALVVTNDVRAAREFNTDVLHLGAAAALGASEARNHVHQWALIGRSVHSSAQLADGLADGHASYLMVGPVWTSTAHPTWEAPGLDLVREAATRAPAFAEPRSTPWFAVGGITPDNVDQVLDAGARRIAVGHGVTGSTTPSEAVTRLKSAIIGAWNADEASEAYVLKAFAD